MKRNIRLATVTLGIVLVSGCQIDTPAATSALDPSSHMEAPAGIQAARGADATVNAQLAELRRLTAPYHNVDKALADGYTIDPVCVSHPTLGAMGHHAPKRAYRDARIALLEPDVLVYEPKSNGGYRLVAVEYLVIKSAWEAANGAGAPPPVILGQPLEYSNHPPLGEHYELHVWLWRHNPSGMFASWNPMVSCT